MPSQSKSNQNTHDEMNFKTLISGEVRKPIVNMQVGLVKYLSAGSPSFGYEWMLQSIIILT
ncbi:hypothetical protein N7471_010569 [Penicillium samsonianum]|uniref:uncharacterized protein n=1 Tax=Penicillium samsonianum TaxID=1882272 RepID=UPI0025498B97|nr:uncharacterized protein N7471_010569 [Penicillium samsonianum]KAJ6126076.1 hypothetical protein N7471_010569 [Penicillium samsonianum]